MRLRDWLIEQGLALGSAAALFGVRSNETVRRYALPAGDADNRMPEYDTMRRIYVATGGRVTPNDFYDLEALKIGACSAPRGGRSAPAVPPPQGCARPAAALKRNLGGGR